MSHIRVREVIEGGETLEYVAQEVVDAPPWQHLQIIESSRLKETFQIIQSYHQASTITVTPKSLKTHHSLPDPGAS